MAKVIHSEEAFADFERIIEFLLGTASDDAARALASIRGATGYVALYRLDRAHDAVRILRTRHQREAGYRE